MVFLPVSEHFTATPGIPPSSLFLQKSRFERNSPVEPMDFTPDAPFRLRTLYAQ